MLTIFSHGTVSKSFPAEFSHGISMDALPPLALALTPHPPRRETLPDWSHAQRMAPNYWTSTAPKSPALQNS